MASKVLGLLVQKGRHTQSTELADLRSLVMTDAERIFGDADKARRWLNAPKIALEGKTPREILETDEGAKLVQSMLVRIEYGMIG